MSKSSSGRGKNQPPLTQHFSQQDKEANKEPLTLDMLVGELEKLHNSVTSELTTSINSALAPLQASLQTLTGTVTSHSTTIDAMETALSSHSDGITALEEQVTTLKSQLETVTQVNEKLQQSVEDLISRSKRKNLRIVGVPEGAEGADTRLFVTTMLKKISRDALQDLDLELERAHRSLAPKPLQGSRPLIVRFHKYIHKERVFQWAKKSRDVSYLGQPIRIFEDFSNTIAKKRASFNKIKSQLYKDGIRFGVIYPARLKITMNGQTRLFDSAEEAELFYLGSK